MSRQAAWNSNLTGEKLERRRARKRTVAKRAGWTPSRAESAKRRRAAKLGAVVERVEIADIFARDGWRCQICNRKISQTKLWPDPMSKSIDHILPLSSGGAHSAANLRATHLRCNISRGNRPAADQLRMVG